MPDLIVYAGDDVRRFRPRPSINYWEELAAFAKYGLVAIRGNDDDPVSSPPIAGEGVTDLGRRSRRIGEFVFHGAEGAEDTPNELGIGHILRSPSAITRDLKHRFRATPGRTLVLVSHSPPRGVLDDAMRFTLGGGLRPIGAYSIRKVMEGSLNIRLVCCGHCHLQGGQDRAVDQAVVVNAASHDDLGARARVAEINLSHEGVTSIVWHELKLALGFDGVPDIGSRRAARFRAAGILHCTDLAAADPARVAEVLGYSPRAAVPFLAAARAVIRGTPVVHRLLSLPRGPRVLLDIETDLAQRQVWIIGLLDEADGCFQQLVARRSQDEPEMLVELRGQLAARGRPVVTWSGSRFDERVLFAAFRRYAIEPPPALLEAQDALISARKSIALPLSDWKLGTVALWCGFEFRHPELDGFRIGAMCSESRPGGRPVPIEVLRYNEDDVRALATVVGKLEGVAANGLSTPEAWRGLPGPKRRRRGAA
jgi:Icc-related predicted phosphoesterase